MLKKMTRRFGYSILALTSLWIGVAAVLVFSPGPRFVHPAVASSVTDSHIATAALAPAPEMVEFKMRDGLVLRGHRFPSSSNTIVLFIHGVLSSGLDYLVTCSQLHQLTGADVIALDLRGHGESAGIPGDTQYIGQYEDDVSDVMTALRSANPEAKVILAGHSMGGGIAMRYAAMHEAPVADAYLLFAPHLGVKSPTMRTEPTANEPFVQLNLRRTVGLVMLNTMRVRWFNSLPTLLFNVPVSSPIHAYSFRAMASTSPDDYVAALTADAKPLLTLVGEGDEVFHAERFPSVISMHKNGRAVMIPGEQHDSIARSSSALSVAVAWIRSLDDPRSLGSAKGKPLQGM